MRALLLAALVAGIGASSAFGQQQLLPNGWKATNLDHWGGLNLLYDSTMIDGDAQQAVNVLTDETYLEKRPGNTLLAKACASPPVKYVTGWPAPSGSDFVVAQCSQTVVAENLSGSTMTINVSPPGCDLTTTPAFSNLYFADGCDPLYTFNGNSTATVIDSINGMGSGATAPTCTYVSYYQTRLWCANLPYGFATTGNATNGGGSSSVLISSVGGAGYWAVPGDVAVIADAPNRFDINPDDGDQINCQAVTPWGVFEGKKNSSWMVKGTDNLSYYTQQLSPNIGCVDNRSVQMVDGVLKWLSVRGVYAYTGSGPPQLLSRKLDPLFTNGTIRESQFSIGSFSTQLQSDWASGTESAATGNLPPFVWDYSALPGSIFPSSGTLYDDNTNVGGGQLCSTNINPQTGTSWLCGAAFSSDTLVNIDTTSFPGSTGYAITQVSTNGAVVWSSSFPAANYTTTPTTWTVLASQAGFYDPRFTAPGFIGANAPTLNSFDNMNVLYTLAPSNPANSPPSNGSWNFGAWTVHWMPLLVTHNPTTYANFGACASGGIECFEFDFISDRPNQINPHTGAYNQPWNGYGISITQESCTTGGTNAPAGNTQMVGGCNYGLNLFKSVAGVPSGLGSTQLTLPVTSTFVGFSTITITRTPGGVFTVNIGTAVTINAQDNTPSTQKAIVSNLQLYSANGSGQTGSNYTATNYTDLVELQGYGTGYILSRAYDTGETSPVAGLWASSQTLPSGTNITFSVQDSPGLNGPWSALTPISDGQLAVLPERYWRYMANFQTSIASTTPQLAYVELDSVATGYYYSKVQFLGNQVTFWKQFSVTGTDPGAYAYAIRSATYAFADNATSPPWTTISNDSQITIATGTYAQFYLDSTPIASNPDGASAAEPINAVFIRWNQGQDLPAASATLDRRYFLCVALSTASTAPDTCLIQQKNGEWIYWRGPSIGSMGLYNYQMVVGDGGASGKVWNIMQPNVYNDDGAAIAASWISSDFTDGSVFNKKVYHEAWVDAAAVQRSSVTFSYSLDKSSVPVSVTFSLDNGQPLDPSGPVNIEQYGDVNQWLEPANGYEVSKYLRVMFSDAQINDYFRINYYEIMTEAQNRQVP